MNSADEARLAGLDRVHRVAGFYRRIDPAAKQRGGKFLSELDPRDVLHDQLAAAVELLNASTDPDERVLLIGEISDLRHRLGIVPRHGGRSA